MAKNKYTPERVAKLVKNPGTRATVPTKYLPASYRKQRELNTYLDSPVTQGSSYTNRQAARERNATVDQKYGAAERQSQAQAAAIPQWYDQYRQLLQAAQQGAQQGYAAATQQMQGLQAATAAQQQQPETAALNQQIAQLGGMADPQQAQVGAQAAAVRAAMAGNLGGVLAAQGANQNAYAANQYANSGKSQLEALQHELDQQQELRTEKGSYGVQTDAAIRDRERKQVLENQAFGLQVANTEADNARADQQLAQSQRQQQASTDRQDATPNQYGYTAKQWRDMSTAQRQKIIRDSKANGNGSNAQRPKPATAQQRNTANTQIQYALTQAKRFKQGKFTRAQAGQTLVVGRPGANGQPGVNKVPQLYASIALDIAYDGHVSRDNAKKLHNMGLTLKDLGLPSLASTRRVKRPSNAPGSNGQRRPT